MKIHSIFSVSVLILLELVQSKKELNFIAEIGSHGHSYYPL